ncbi:MAG: hypothetical protein NXH70_17045 [Hyphomonas sp.]|nr:hypothetical protein [Hyphomonas sp.]
MDDMNERGMTLEQVAAEAAEAERETLAHEAVRKAEWEAWVASLPTKHQRYYNRNKVQRSFEAAMARAKKLDAVPDWLTDAQRRKIFEVYEAADALHDVTGIPHEVDHIVQLVGKNKAGEPVICGLHVPWNLRAIPWSLNRKRGDWFYIAACERVDTNSDDEILAAF